MGYIRVTSRMDDALYYLTFILRIGERRQKTLYYRQAAFFDIFRSIMSTHDTSLSYPSTKWY
jgi:hypothetical protein